MQSLKKPQGTGEDGFKKNTSTYQFMFKFRLYINEVFIFQINLLETFDNLFLGVLTRCQKSKKLRNKNYFLFNAIASSESVE